jgi:hypothetical protein
MRLQIKSTWRSAITFALLAIGIAILLYELEQSVPVLLARRGTDYTLYVQWGSEYSPLEHSGASVPNYYPLPTTLWVFLPLSLLPNWFTLVWTFVPFLFLLWLFRKSGIILWLSYPMLIQGSVGQMDGWLLLPLYWLFTNRPRLAGIGAALLLFKPQLAFLTILYALLAWLIRRDWHNFGAFIITLAILYLPAFVVNPLWPLIMLERMKIRASEPLLETRGASLWAWIWHGGWTLWLLPIVALIAAALVIYVFMIRRRQIQAVHLLGLMVTPVLYSSNFVTIIPMLKTTRQIATLTTISWVGVVIDILAGGWGGAYVVIPLTALWLLAANASPHPPPHHKLRAKKQR